ncbi:hypothetical protein VB776_16280 [Arcicella sp. DC2W]|uniref:Uncharacterized protein n=1 Tax=Arcicella gelida TaxID=2984195 RepID=A0ABU5S7N4_9BACT|nr:hypothetical protein [Arcicella sp. DC2W]MEA5404491.1 hypothetical protein [Arcicella sp. DC2W]
MTTAIIYAIGYIIFIAYYIPIIKNTDYPNFKAMDKLIVCFEVAIYGIFYPIYVLTVIISYIKTHTQNERNTKKQDNSNS